MERTASERDFALFAFWFIYGLVSLLWAKSVTAGIKYLALLAMEFSSFTSLSCTCKNGAAHGCLYHLAGDDSIPDDHWFYNHMTHHHLPSSTLYSGPEYKRHYPTSVFLIKMTLQHFYRSASFYITLVKNIKNGYIKAIGLLLSLCALYLILLPVQEPAFWAFLPARCLHLHCIAACSKENGHLAVCGRNHHFAVLFAGRIYSKFWELFLAPQTPHSFHDMLPSNVARANLLKNAWHFSLIHTDSSRSRNVSYYLEHHALYDTDNVTEVHNWLVEILANFGLFIMLGYLAVYAYLIWVLYKFHERKLGNQSKLITEGLITALVSFLVSSISPSSVSNLFFHWVFLALVIAAVNVLRRSRQMPEPLYR